MIREMLRYEATADLLDQIVSEVLEEAIDLTEKYIADENSLFIGTDKADATEFLEAAKIVFDYFRMPS